jgi:hypothetical protein
VPEPQIPRATVPADIDTPDTIAWGLSFRQLAIIAGVAATGWLAYSTFGPLLPGPVWLLIAAPAVALTAVIVLGRRDGLALDVWLRHGLTLRRTPRLQTPGSPTAGPALTVTSAPVPAPAPLRGPAVQVAADGTLTVDGTGRCIIACGTTSITLRTGSEQAGLLAGFGQWLNALTGPAQFVVATRRHDLTVQAQAVTGAAAHLPDPALRAAAGDYANFLRDLDTQREPLRRQVLCVTTQGPFRDAAVRGFTAAGISATVLDGQQVTAALAAAADPYAPPVPGPRALPDDPITRS